MKKYGKGFRGTLFNTVRVEAPNSNTFDLSHTVEMTMRMGDLYPCMVAEVIPGDKVKLGCETYLQYMPLVAPARGRMELITEYYFVANRIIWDNWEDFISLKSTGGLPTISVTQGMTDAQKKFLDYMGIPPCNTAVSATVNALPLAAYAKIWNDNYRDQNLIAELDLALIDGAQTGTMTNTLTTLRRSAYKHDYFTAALPFAQKGSAVDIPLGNVELLDDWQTVGSPTWNAAGSANPPVPQHDGDVLQSGGVAAVDTTGGPPIDPSAYNPDGTLVVGATTINDLRRAFKLQEFLELMARTGNRYVEFLKGLWNVTSSDARLQRPEFITGSKSPVIVSEVSATAETTELPQGNLSGKAAALGSGYNGYYTAEDYGYIIGVVRVIPMPKYFQGIPRHYLRTDPLDFANPKFAHLGEQEILTQELFAYTSADTDIFGYIPRFAEYKYIPNRIAGDLRTTLAFWSVQREFASPPVLNQEFIEVDPDALDDIFAVQDGSDNLILEIVNLCVASRKLPVYGTPRL